MTENWTSDLENEFKENINKLFEAKIKECIESSVNAAEAGNNLAELLKSLENEIVKIVTPRAVKKWASAETLPLWEKFLENDKMISELREIGKSIANSLRPFAGNRFATWVALVLSNCFMEEKLPLVAVTKGKIKQSLVKLFKEKQLSEPEEVQEFKPDIDIVVARNDLDKVVPIVIISAKTTLAERVMQTISWQNHIQDRSDELKNLKLFLVTAWETFDKNNANKYRVQQLDGVYVCNPDVQEFGKIKLFSKIIDDLKALL